ncbi:MAG: DinB family protein [Bacteroidota bacterium]
MQQPNKDEYAAYYQTYVEKVPEGNIIKILKKQTNEVKKLFKNVSKKKSLFRYSPEKWSVREVLGHIIDTERIFAYRALRFARSEQKDLPAFDENEYIRQSNYHVIKLANLVDEFCALRKSNLLMLKNFSDEMWLRKGTANNNSFTVRAMAYIMAGHVNHHLNVLREKYL